MKKAVCLILCLSILISLSIVMPISASAAGNFTNMTFDYLTDIVCSGNYIFVLDRDGNSNISKFDLQGNFIKTWYINLYQGEDEGLAVDNNGNILVCGSDGDCYTSGRGSVIKRFDINGNLISTYYYEFFNPQRIAVNKNGDIYVACMWGVPHVRVFNSNGAFLRQFDIQMGCWLSMDIAVDSNSNVYFSNGQINDPNGTVPIQKYSANGTLISNIVPNDKNHGFYYLHIDQNDNLYAIDNVINTATNDYQIKVYIYDKNVNLIGEKFLNAYPDITTDKFGNIYYVSHCGGNIYTAGNMKFASNASVPVNVSVSSIGIPSTLSMKVGSNYTITPQITPSDATNKTVTWSSSDTNIVTVAGGVLYAKNEGTATITAKAINGGKSSSCVVTISNSDEIKDTNSVRAITPMSQKEVKNLLKFLTNGSFFYNEKKSEFYPLLMGQYANNPNLEKEQAAAFLNSVLTVIEVQINGRAEILDISQLNLTNYIESQASNYDGFWNTTKTFLKEVVKSDEILNITYDRGFVEDHIAYVTAVAGLMNVFKYNSYRYLNEYLKLRKQNLEKWQFDLLISSYGVNLEGANINELNTWGEYIYNLDQSLPMEYKKIVTAKCPVVMQIFNENNELVMQLDNAEEGNIHNEYGSFYIIKEESGDNYLKIAKLNSDKYTVIITGTGDGTMDYNICYINSDETIESYNYISIPVNENSVLQTKTDILETSQITVYDADNVCGEVEISPSLLMQNNIELNSTDGGESIIKNSVSGILVEGEVVEIEAIAEPGYHFSSWSTEDVDVNNNSLISFTMPNKTVKLTANFEKDDWRIESLEATEDMITANVGFDKEQVSELPLLIVATYNSNESLIRMDYQPININENTYTFNISSTGVKKIKAFLWSNLNYIKPAGSSIEVSAE